MCLFSHLCSHLYEGNDDRVEPLPHKLRIKCESAVLKFIGFKTPLHLKAEDSKELFLCKLCLLIVTVLEMKSETF